MPIRAQILKEAPHVAQRIDAVDAGDDRGRLDLRQHLALGSAEDQFVGIEDGQHAGERAVALHAEVAGVVDADQVDAAALDEFRGDAVAGAGHDQPRGPSPISARKPVEAVLPGIADRHVSAAPAAWPASGRSASLAASVAKAGSLMSRSRSTIATRSGAPCAERGDEGRVGVRIVERLALRGVAVIARRRNEEHRVARRSTAGASADLAADLGHLVAVQPEVGDLRAVADETRARRTSPARSPAR